MRIAFFNKCLLTFSTHGKHAAPTCPRGCNQREMDWWPMAAVTPFGRRGPYLILPLAKDSLTALREPSVSKVFTSPA